MIGVQTIQTCMYCGRPVVNAIYIATLPYHVECTHGPSWQTAPTEDRVRQIVRDEIERLKDQIEHGLGVRP